MPIRWTSRATNYQLSLLARPAARPPFFSGIAGGESGTGDGGTGWGEGLGVAARCISRAAAAAAAEGTLGRQGGGVRRVSIPSRGL